MMTDSTRNVLITRLGLRPLAGAAHVTDAQLRQALAAEDYVARQPQRAAERQARLQAERECEERGRRRFGRIQAANEAVDAYMRTSGTRNYQAAFSHIQRTRPELFADPQVPAHEAVAGNFNPNHDRLGRFTTSDGAVAPHGRGHLAGFGARSLMIAAVGEPQAEKKEYQGKISAGAYFQPGATGECSIAIAREAVTQVETVRTVGDQPLPKGADSPMQALQSEVGKDGESRGYHFDFSQAGGYYEAAIQDVIPVLSKKFNIHSQPVTIDQIPEALKQGPVMVDVYDGGHKHGELIIGMNKDGKGNDIPGSCRVYNPLNPVARAATLDASQIIRDGKGRPELFALRPYRLGEKHPEDASHPLPQAGRQK